MAKPLKHPPLLSSESAGWQNIQVEYHCQPAQAMAEQTFPAHIIEVGLRYTATSLKVNRRLYQAFAPGNITVYRAYEPISVES
ncbi:MAG: AraC family transcriptional regulator, partial [Cyanobacteria bacterium J06649_4]